MDAIRKCAVEGHEFQGRMTKGMCGKHYARWSRKGTTDSDRDYTHGGKLCSNDPTHGKAHAKGLCSSCDGKARRAAGDFGSCAHKSGSPEHPADGGADGYCATHRRRADLGLDMDAPIRAWIRQKGKCSVTNCPKVAKTIGMCKEHAKRPGDDRILSPGRPEEHGQSGSYGPGWYAAKRTVQERDGRMCRACGMTESQNGKQLPVAHLLPAGSFEKHLWPVLAHHEANLILLCPKCHSNFDNSPETRWNYRTGGGRNVWPEWTAQPIGIKLDLARKMLEVYADDITDAQRDGVADAYRAVNNLGESD